MDAGGAGRLNRSSPSCLNRPAQRTAFFHGLLTASERVQRLQTALHAKAKGAPGFRFYSLSDKVWREDVLAVAWQAVRRNGGAAGVDGETVADIESQGVDRWLGALARDLKAGTYRPRAVRHGNGN